MYISESHCMQQEHLQKYHADLPSLYSSLVPVTTCLYQISSLTLSPREAAHIGSGVLAMGREAAVNGSPVYPGQF